MNYITSIKNKVDSNKVIATESIEMIHEFMKYLRSSKFHMDSTIQTWECNNVLQELRSKLIDIANA